MLECAIKRIQNEFVKEAKNSPRLLEDLSSMEKYIAESYGNRIIIELLQNADDACSKKVKLLYKDGNIFFANDGKEFTDKDVESICRSGASEKNRGTSIGYRGIGFKSTSNIASEILIYSAGTVFTFSRNHCAEVLGIKDINKIPMVRIPFLVEYDYLDISVKKCIQELKEDGYSTVFIFVNADKELLLEEIEDINSGYFIFLNNILNAEFSMGSADEKTFDIRRSTLENISEVAINVQNRNEYWRIYSYFLKEKKVDIAFKSTESGELVRCDDSEATFHCYLPTLEKTGYGFKINSDFSTDPSRKHLVFDSETTAALEASSLMLFYLVSEVVSNEIEMKTDSIFEMLTQRNSFSKAAIKLSEEFERHIYANNWVKTGCGDFSNIKNYKVKPSWLEPSEYKVVREYSSYLASYSLNPKIYEIYPNIDKFLNKFSTNSLDIYDLTSILRENKVITKVNSNLYGKLYSNLIKILRLGNEVELSKINVEDCLITNNGNTITVKELAELGTKGVELSSDFMEGLIASLFSSTDLEWFDNKYGTSLTKLSVKAFKARTEKGQNVKTKTSEDRFSWSTKGENSMEEKTKTENISTMPIISRWRSSEYIVVELEKSFGNRVKDVSLQNIGYDVESITKEGTVRYIEVKSITNNSGIFAMTNNEYSEANQKKENYFICIVLQNEKEIKVTYIKNPIENLQLEKRCRAWEWVCSRYNGETILLPLSN